MGHYSDQYELNAWKVEQPKISPPVERLQIPGEMYGFLKVLVEGAKKYSPNNWLEPDGTNSDHKSMHASMFRHLAQSSVGLTEDEVTGLHPLLHLAARALMTYTRQVRGIVHTLDK